MPIPGGREAAGIMSQLLYPLPRATQGALNLATVRRPFSFAAPILPVRDSYLSTHTSSDMHSEQANPILIWDYTSHGPPPCQIQTADWFPLQSQVEPRGCSELARSLEERENLRGGLFW